MSASVIKGRLRYSIKQAKIMQQQYECVIANPPYMGNNGMSTKLSEYVKISREHISCLEHGKHSVNIETLYKLAEFFEVDIKYFF